MAARKTILVTTEGPTEFLDIKLIRDGVEKHL